MSLAPKRVPDASKRAQRTTLKPSWKKLGPSRKLFGGSGGRLAIVLEPPEGGCGACWEHLRAILSRLGASLERLDPDFPVKWNQIDAFHLCCHLLDDF